MNAEEVKVGCFQMVLVLLLGVNYVIVAMSHALPVFHNYTPKFYCQAKNSTTQSYGCQDVANSSIGANTTAATSASCSSEYRFETEHESSVVTEWGLVCEKRYLSFLGPTVYYVGVLLGAWIAGFLADRIGRLPVQAICLYAQGTMAVALYVVQNYPAFLALRGLQGVFVQGLQNSTYILALELLPARSRTLVALVMQISWSLGLVLLAVLSYAIPDWRILQLAVSVPTAITVLYIWIVPESPRWLLARGKSTEADMAFERIAKYNGCCRAGSRAADAAEQEARAKSNTTPLKPERRSRVTSVDLQKARSDDNRREEATNLLNGSEPTEQEATKKATEADSAANAVERFSNVESRREAQDSAEDFLPSSSKVKYDRESRARASQSGYDRRGSSPPGVTPGNEAVLRRTKKRGKARENAGEKKNDEIEKRTGGGKTRPTLKDSFESSTLRKYGAIMISQWLTSAMACGILDDLAPNFLVNRHITFALGGALEIATYTFMYFVLSRHGRRLPMCAYQSLNGVVCILIAAFLILTSVAAPPWTDLAKTITLLFGRVTVTSTVSVAYLYTVEIFPTVVRGSCLGLCLVFAKIGNLSVPHLLLSGRHVSFPVPLLVVGTLCLVCGALALVLPETLNRILPDRAADVEGMAGSNDNDGEKNNDGGNDNAESGANDLTERRILREKLFSEDWVDAGNGILVNFSENKNAE